MTKGNNKFITLIIVGLPDKYSITNGLGVPLGFTKKWEDCSVLYENKCQNESVTTKTFDSNG